MTRIFICFCLAVMLVSCSDDYVIGGDVNEVGVDKTTYEFLGSFEDTDETARLFEKAGMIDEINGDVTVIAPSNYAVNRYLRRKNNRRMRLDPNSEPWTLEDIPVDELTQNLGMYVVDGKYWSENIPEEGIVLPTHKAGDTLRLSLEESTAEPGMAWDGGSTPGWGYQYPNFMQSLPKKVFVHYKRGNNWEMTANERVSLGYDNPECDQVYQMLISDVVTNTGVVHVIYSGNYNYSDHYYYHTLFFFGTREDDLL